MGAADVLQLCSPRTFGRVGFDALPDATRMNRHHGSVPADPLSAHGTVISYG
jgi:hypothetical protein